MTAVRFDDVWFTYGERPLLRGVTFSVSAGETVALLGGNGAGKTTLTKLMAGLLQPVRGAVWVGEQQTSGKAPEDLSSWVAYVFQHPEDQLFARTVLDEAAFAARQQGRDRREAKDRATSALERVGLVEMEAAHPYDLSPAQRKLVTLAAAIAQDAQMLVLDEPTLGLDQSLKAMVSDVVRRHTGGMGTAARGRVAFVVSHDVGFVTETCDRTLVLADGRIAYDGATRDLLYDQARLEVLGIVPPPVINVSQALTLAGRPVRFDDVAAALGERCRGSGWEITSRFANDQR